MELRILCALLVEWNGWEVVARTTNVVYGLTIRCYRIQESLWFGRRTINYYDCYGCYDLWPDDGDDYWFEFVDANVLVAAAVDRILFAPLVAHIEELERLQIYDVKVDNILIKFKHILSFL